MTIETFKNHKPIIGKQCFIHNQALVLGRVTLGEDVSIWPMTVLRGDVSTIKIGNRTNIQDSSICHVTHYNPKYGPESPLIVGDDVTIGHGVILHACTVKDRVLVGMHSTLLDGAIIESDVMIGAHSLVPPGKHLESGYLYVGAPVKPIRKLSDEEIQFLKYSAEHYVDLKNEYL